MKLGKLKNINTNTILIIVIAIVTMLYLKQCNRSSNLKDEVTIANMNRIALADSITTYTDKAGDLTFEKGILVASKEELKSINKDLYDKIKHLKNNPKVVFVETIVIKHDTLNVDNVVFKYKDGSTGISWNYDKTFSVGNYQKLSGESRFTHIGDSIQPGTTSINVNEIGMSFTTGLSEGKDSYKIFIKSDYPGFIVTDITGSIIDKKMITSNESAVVFGPSVGYGLVFNTSSVNHGVFVGVTATYNLNKHFKKLFRPFGL